METRFVPYLTNELVYYSPLSLKGLLKSKLRWDQFTYQKSTEDCLYLDCSPLFPAISKHCTSTVTGEPNHCNSRLCGRNGCISCGGSSGSNRYCMLTLLILRLTVERSQPCSLGRSNIWRYGCRIVTQSDGVPPGNPLQVLDLPATGT